MSVRKQKVLAFGRATGSISSTSGKSHKFTLHLGHFNTATLAFDATGGTGTLPADINALLQDLFGVNTGGGIMSLYPTDWSVGPVDIFTLNYNTTTNQNDPDTFVTTIAPSPNLVGNNPTPIVLASQATLSFKTVDGRPAKVEMLDTVRAYPFAKIKAASLLSPVEANIVSRVLANSASGALVSVGNAEIKTFKSYSIVENRKLARRYGLR